jgi:Tol biopolymer transport system component
MDARLKTRIASATLFLIGMVASAQAATPGPIAFVRGGQVYSIAPEGGVSTRLTIAADPHRDPRYSPDGAGLLYSSEREGRWDLYVAAADGTGETALTTDAMWERDARWSPDGTEIAYTSGGRLWTVDVATGQAVPLTSSGLYHSPRYSPDGTLIVAVNSHSYRDSSIEVVSAAEASTALTTAMGYEFWPSWSPDGAVVAYARRPPGSNYRVWIVSADGTGRTRISLGPGDDIEPSFSPATDAIAFIRVAGETRDLFVYDLNTQQTTRLTAFGGRGVQSFTWSPDGIRLTFTRHRGGRPDLYVIDADGTDLQRLTTTRASESQPDWGSAGS